MQRRHPQMESARRIIAPPAGESTFPGSACAPVSAASPAVYSTPLLISIGTRLGPYEIVPTRLFVRRLDQSTATELPGTQGAAVPLFSPDGQWVGFVAGTKLSKVSVEGGAAVAIGDVAGTHVAGAHWGEESGVLVSEAFGNRGLIRLPAGGGPPETIMGLGSEELAFAVPRLLPGGKAILFATDTAMDVDTITIEVLTLGDRKRKIVARGRHSPRYLSAPDGSGYLVYTNRTALSRSRSTWRRSRRAGRPCASWTMSPTTR